MDREKITYKGKPLPQLSKTELRDALVDAVKSRNSYRRQLNQAMDTLERASKLSDSVERIFRKSRGT